MDDSIYRRALSRLDNYDDLLRNENNTIGMFVDVDTGIRLGSYRSLKFEQRGLIEEFVWNDCNVCTQGFWEGKLEEAFTKIHAVVSVSMYKYKESNEYWEYLTKEELLQFYDILLNHTPYKKCIQPCSPEYARDYGFVIDCSYPRNLVIGALMAHRLAWENTKIVKTMLALANLGVSKDIVFMLGHVFDKEGGMSVKSWHVPLDGGNVSLDTLKRFRACDYVIEPSMMESRFYLRTIHASFGSGYSASLVQDITKHNKDKAGVVVVDNPFAKTLELVAPSSTIEDVAEYFKLPENKAQMGIHNE